MVRLMREGVRWVLKCAVEVGGRGGWISSGRGWGFEVEDGGEEDGGRVGGVDLW